MTDKIIEAARAAGITFEEDSHGRGEAPFNAERPSVDEIARFYAIARAEALEDAAKACRPFGKTGAVVAAAIRALKERP